MSNQVETDILSLTAKIVSAHVAANQVETNTLPSLIQSVYRSLSTAGEIQPAPAVVIPPAVSATKSVFPDYIICLEDGQKMKMLKRHLQIKYGLTPSAYRAKWGLPYNYPMVAPSYTAMRSGVAKKTGLGRKPASKAVATRPDVKVAKVPGRHRRSSER